MGGIPEKTLNMALRFLAGVPFDQMPRALPDDDGETMSAVLVYSQLERDDKILWSITASGITRMQGVDGLPSSEEMQRTIQ